jgi:hypothetical protein
MIPSTSQRVSQKGQPYSYGVKEESRMRIPKAVTIPNLLEELHREYTDSLLGQTIAKEIEIAQSDYPGGADPRVWAGEILHVITQWLQGKPLPALEAEPSWKPKRVIVSKAQTDKLKAAVRKAALAKVKKGAK